MKDTYNISKQWAAVKTNLSEIIIEVQEPLVPSKDVLLLAPFTLTLNFPHSKNDENTFKHMSMHTML